MSVGFVSGIELRAERGQFEFWLDRKVGMSEKENVDGVEEEVLLLVTRSKRVSQY